MILQWYHLSAALNLPTIDVIKREEDPENGRKTSSTTHSTKSKQTDGVDLTLMEFEELNSDSNTSVPVASQ